MKCAHNDAPGRLDATNGMAMSSAGECSDLSDQEGTASKDSRANSDTLPTMS